MDWTGRTGVDWIWNRPLGWIDGPQRAVAPIPGAGPKPAPGLIIELS
jgi:hypothetical protein